MLFYLIMVLFTMSVTELFAHLLYVVWQGEFLWETYEHKIVEAQEVFSVRDFIYPVTDERFFAIKADYVYQYPNLKWSVTFDNHGFRVGSYEYSQARENIIFLGDSVPFGWGLDDTQTVPSQFYKLLSEIDNEPTGVINAAVPSYSLHQAVQKYKYELHNKFPAKYVVLQTYDPVTQFKQFGQNWHKNLNWFTRKQTATNNNPLLKYSAMSWLFEEGRNFLFSKETGVDINDREAFETFRSENIASLDEINSLLTEQNTGLILLPVTVPETTKKSMSLERRAIIRYLNDIFREYAATHPNVNFFDIENRLYKFDADVIFLDDCCHLTNVGARLQAEFLLRWLLNQELLHLPEPAANLSNLPVGPLEEAMLYLADRIKSGEAIIRPTTTKYFQVLGDDLTYLDRESIKFPQQLHGRWYIFLGVEHIPERWKRELEFKAFDYVLIVHRSGCNIEVCLADTQRLFKEIAQANPTSILAEKINEISNNLSNIPIAE